MWGGDHRYHRSLYRMKMVVPGFKMEAASWPGLLKALPHIWLYINTGMRGCNRTTTTFLSFQTRLGSWNCLHCNQFRVVIVNEVPWTDQQTSLQVSSKSRTSRSQLAAIIPCITDWPAPGQISTNKSRTKLLPIIMMTPNVSRAYTLSVFRRV